MESNKQNEIYEFLRTYTEDKGYPPTVREICEAVSLSSTSTVHGHLRRLERKGLVKRDPTKPRALEISTVLASSKELLEIPIIKKITLGIPLMAPENIEGTFSLPPDYIKHDKELFMLKVHGQDMININIRKNDSVITEKTDVVENGDIVAALINDSIIIRRFFKEKNSIILQPENDDMEPIIVNDCKVVGKVIGTFRALA